MRILGMVDSPTVQCLVLGIWTLVDLYRDQRKTFKEICAAFVSEGVQRESGEAKLAVMSALSVLLQVPLVVC
jgi:hypothetical protein